MAIKLKQLDIDPNGKQANYPEYQYPTDVRNPNAAPLPEWVDPLSYKPSPIAASKTRAGEIPNYSTEVQLEKAASAVGKNNAKAQNLENEKNGMVGGVLPATETPAQRSDRIFQQNHGSVTASGLVNGNGVYEYNGVSTQTPTGYTDINALTDKLRADQEAERAKFERKRMADRISRMGFALGNLLGAGGGTTDASAITLDDGTKTVNEYRKDMEDINKQNQLAYQRALDMIYRKEDRDYKNASLEASRAYNADRIAEQIRHNQEIEDLNRSKFEEAQSQNEIKNKQTDRGLDIRQQNANKTGNGRSGGSGNGGGKTNQNGTQTVTKKTDKDGNIITTVTTRTPYNGKKQNNTTGSLINFGTPTMLNFQ